MDNFKLGREFELNLWGVNILNSIATNSQISINAEVSTIIQVLNHNGYWNIDTLERLMYSLDIISMMAWLKNLLRDHHDSIRRDYNNESRWIRLIRSIYAEFGYAINSTSPLIMYLQSLRLIEPNQHIIEHLISMMGVVEDRMYGEDIVKMNRTQELIQELDNMARPSEFDIVLRRLWDGVREYARINNLTMDQPVNHEVEYVWREDDSDSDEYEIEYASLGG